MTTSIYKEVTDGIKLVYQTARNILWDPQAADYKNKTRISRPQPYMEICKHYNGSPFQLKWTSP